MPAHIGYGIFGHVRKRNDEERTNGKATECLNVWSGSDNAGKPAPDSIRRF
jgi:hypothetical protein